MIAIDVGCASHGRFDSIERIIGEYAPRILFGFDPHRSVGGSAYRQEGTFVVESPVAVWTKQGHVRFISHGAMSRVCRSTLGDLVRCIDISALVRACANEHGLLLKLDVEGGEYPLLRRLIETRDDRLVTHCLVEWHWPNRGRAKIEAAWAGGELQAWTL